MIRWSVVGSPLCPFLSTPFYCCATPHPSVAGMESDSGISGSEGLKCGRATAVSTRIEVTITADQKKKTTPIDATSTRSRHV
jgi:hypothetical protein